MRHAKTPWEMDIARDDAGIPDEVYIYSGHKEIGSINDENDAEFIVKAVNNHDKLVEALKNVSESLATLYENKPEIAGEYFGAKQFETIKLMLAEVKK